MEIMKRVFAVFLLVVFVAYSGGIGFSVHNCEHCKQKKVYFFQHPDCCEAARAEHHHQADNCENTCHHDADCCHHQTEKTVKNVNMPHCQPCCVTKFQFYKIQGNYFAPKYEKLVKVADFTLFTEILSVCFERPVLEKINLSENKPNPPPLLPGGERFIVFTHQLLFYA